MCTTGSHGCSRYKVVHDAGVALVACDAGNFKAPVRYGVRTNGHAVAKGEIMAVDFFLGLSLGHFKVEMIASYLFLPNQSRTESGTQPTYLPR